MIDALSKNIILTPKNIIRQKMKSKGVPPPTVDSLEQLELRRDGLSKQKWMASSPQEASSEISNLLSAISWEI